MADDRLVETIMFGGLYVYVAQSETVVTHLAQVTQGGLGLTFEFVGRAVDDGRLEIVEIACEYD